MTDSILDITDLHIHFGKTHAVKGVSFSLKKGEVLGLVGASGSGKSAISQAIMGLLPSKGTIHFLGQDLLSKSKKEMETIRGNQVAMISQHVMTALHPTKTIGKQIAETIKQHKKCTYKEALIQAASLLKSVKLPDHLNAYPHELSGGMRQRAMIALALSCDPELLIADEPTTALDVTIQAEIISLLKNLQQEKALSILFITHDLKLADAFCNRIIAIHQGEIADTLEKPPTILPTKLSTKEPLLHIHSLSKNYQKPVVQNASFSINKGETLALIGESGSGKTTLGKMLAHILSPSKGSITYPKKITTQMIFQDPYGSLNPRMTIQKILQEPLTIHRLPKTQEDLIKLLHSVDLSEDLLKCYPHELSGGMRQRIGIARALALTPSLLICDEPLSSLDVTTQYHILKLLQSLQQKCSLSYLFITHDLELVQHFAHRILVMHEGVIVESGETAEIFNKPQHEYTKRLLDSALMKPLRSS